MDSTVPIHQGENDVPNSNNNGININNTTMSTPRQLAILNNMIHNYRQYRDLFRQKKDTLYDVASKKPAVNRILTMRNQEPLVFSLALWTIIILSAVIAHYPTYFKWCYLFIMLIIYPLRVLSYMQSSCVAYCMDFCYFANAIVLFALFTDSKIATQISFGVVLTVLSAVVTWGNILLLHSLDKLTSCFVHLAPSLGLYVHVFLTQRDTPYTLPFSFFGYFGQPILFYFAWQVFYASVADILNADLYEKNPNRESSVHYFSKNAEKSVIAQFATRCARKIGLFAPDEVMNGYKWNTKILFYTFQFLYTLAFMPFSWLLYIHQYVFFTVLCICITLVINQGSLYYVSTTYLKDVINALLMAEHRRKQRAAAAANGTANPSSPTSPTSVSLQQANSARAKAKLLARQRQQRHLKDLHDTLHSFLSQANNTPNSITPKPAPSVDIAIPDLNLNVATTFAKPDINTNDKTQLDVNHNEEKEVSTTQQRRQQVD